MKMNLSCFTAKIELLGGGFSEVGQDPGLLEQEYKAKNTQGIHLF